MTSNETENQSAVAEPSAAEEAATETAAAGDAQVVKLQEQLAQSEAKVAEHWDALLRSRAETENIRRRSERDLENAHKFALERFAQALLPVIDSLEMGAAAAQSPDVAVEKLREGTELTLKMFESLLGKFNLIAINPLRQPFNPEWHQAVSMVESAEQPPNTVVSVLQKGYSLNDRLIRPAMVVVAKAPAEGT